MKHLLDFGVSAPLTLEMGHPLEARLQQLCHVDRDKKILPTAIGALLLFGSSISSVSAKTDDIIKQAAEPIFNVIEVQSDTKIQNDLVLTVAETTLNPEGKTPQAAPEKAVNEAVPVVVKTASVEWPGYPATNSPWETRPLSARMQGAMQDIIDKCARSSVPICFVAPILDGDEDMGRGDFNVECTPGSEATQANTTRRDLAHAWLASEDIPLEKRQSGMGWRMHFALMEEYVSKTQGASLAKDRSACVRHHTLIKEKYTYSDADRAVQDNFLEKCSDADYNWVRRRMGVREVQ